MSEQSESPQEPKPDEKKGFWIRKGLLPAFRIGSAEFDTRDLVQIVILLVALVAAYNIGMADGLAIAKACAGTSYHLSESLLNISLIP